MAFDLSHIPDTPTTKPPRVLIYGPPGVGKTTWAAGLPAPIVLRTEDGLGVLRVPHFPEVATTYQDVLDAVTALITTDHPYQTLVVDSVTSLEPLVWARTCQRLGINSIEQPGFGKGYVEADEEWAMLLDGFDALRDRGLVVVLVAHNVVTRFSDPAADDYDRHEVSLHKRARGMVTKWADVTAFAHWKVLTKTIESGFNKKTTKGIATDQRLLGLVERPFFDAKNRYQLPAVLPLDAAAFLEAMASTYPEATGVASDTTTGREAEEIAG